MPAPPEAGAGPAGHEAARPTPHPSEHGVAPPRTGRAPECEQVEIVNILLLCFGQTAVETCLALVCCQHSSRRKCLQQSSYGNVTLGPVVQQDGCHLWLQGTPIEFESDLFVGRVAMWVKGLPTAAPDLFKGKRRRTRITVQGRFKRPVPFEEVRTMECWLSLQNWGVGSRSLDF